MSDMNEWDEVLELIYNGNEVTLASVTSTGFVMEDTFTPNTQTYPYFFDAGRYGAARLVLALIQAEINLRPWCFDSFTIDALPGTTYECDTDRIHFSVEEDAVLARMLLA